MQSAVEAGKRYALKPEGAGPGPLRVGISGILSRHGQDLLGTGQVIDSAPSATLVFDLSGVDYLDSTGALALVLSRDRAARKSIQLRMTGMSAETGRMLGIVDRDAALPGKSPQRTAPGAWARLQDAAARLSDHLDLLCVFVGDLAASLAASLVRPRSVRWDAVLFTMKRAGMEGLPTVGLISLLLGLIMAFMASLQLRMFG
jgi:phospholipid/cholesterol/gamma-HCH transport system permease protein